jgi:uncharacterized repeat protein (TIGR01451 family)
VRSTTSGGYGSTDISGSSPKTLSPERLSHRASRTAKKARMAKGAWRVGRRVVLSAGMLVLLALMFGSVSAFAGEARPGWGLTTGVFTTNIAPSGGKGVVEVNVFNTGAAKSTGTVTVTDVLPPGVVATEAGDVQQGDAERITTENGLWNCTGNAQEEAPREIGKFKAATVVTCVNSELLTEIPLTEAYGTSGRESGAGTVLHIALAIETTTSIPGTLTNAVTIAGGGASGPASTSAPIVISPVPASAFGFQSLDGWFSDAEGETDTQAGSHPYDFTFSFNLNTNRGREELLKSAGGEARDITVNLPPGFIGNPTALPQCTRQQFDFEECSPSTQVGIDQAGTLGINAFLPFRAAFAVYNLVPPPGVPAEFALDLAGVQVFLDANVRSGGDYGLVVHVNNIGNVDLMYNNITFWGEPSDSLHNDYRFSKKGDVGASGAPECTQGCSSSAPRIPFLTLPTSCGAPQTYSASITSWETNAFSEASFLSHDSDNSPVGFTGCDHLTFKPSISAAPDTARTDTPVGLTVEVKAPQEGLATTGALAPSDIKSTTVTLPQGIVINPGQAAGLQDCQYSETGLGIEPTVSEPSKGEPHCPNASKVGTDEAITPILFKPLTGNVYVLPSNPPHLKLLAALAGEGVVVKLVLEVELSETGQITTHVLNIPQAPVSDFKIAFTGGAQAALATPLHCGAYQTTADFTPWSTPEVGDAFPSSSFEIDGGANNSGCPSSPLPFTPTLTAGSTTDQAGGFTNFSLLLQRGDDQQRIAALQFKAPQGLLGEISNVPLCTNAQAEANECPATSKIGHTVVESGPGPDPLVVSEPGQPPAPIYLTETYKGAPFGLSVVVPLHVGPFTLPTQRVRAKIEVNPITTQLTITTNELPQIVAGVPTDLREVDAVIEHEKFMINPTNCNQQEFSGTATGTPPPGTGGPSSNAKITSPFQVGSCQSLKFQPKLTVTTNAHTSKKYGASLTVKLAYPNGAVGTNAWLKEMKFDIPKQLPARLTTLQKACVASVFETNPAACPPASNIGTAIVHTPLLPVIVSGPVYFVSHGGAKFPEVVLILQGDNVTVYLHGETFISKAGVTSATFRTVPDVPFETAEVILPTGRYSEFTALGNLCTEKLAMANALTAENGLETHQNTAINTTGCTKTKTLTRAQKLTAALKVCHKNKKKTKRETCEKQAHKKYGPTKNKKKTAKKK